eukprot:CAMPEP_0184651136 /NCGR_PEP_ID=MMETSP0308-20130426/8711_1 /TAXON_ID=38269 /ORGANISM="Gloeochaete witrockiana, Strain SAG 46.84" /LENGTH=444 /DNA_ID=CAMNT_0027085135 /DNA_START=247 /DNA_END=1581 /DNA_ORIENTATION=+
MCFYDPLSGVQPSCKNNQCKSGTTGCNDYDPCTVNKTCVGGQCIGSPRVASWRVEQTIPGAAAGIMNMASAAFDDRIVLSMGHDRLLSNRTRVYNLTSATWKNAADAPVAASGAIGAGTIYYFNRYSVLDWKRRGTIASDPSCPPNCPSYDDGHRRYNTMKDVFSNTYVRRRGLRGTEDESNPGRQLLADYTASTPQVVTPDTPGQNRVMYVTGGLAKAGRTERTIFAYDTVNNTWDTSLKPMTVARTRHASIVVTHDQGGYTYRVFCTLVFVIGGVTHDGTYLDHVEGYLAEENVWINATRLPSPRADATAIEIHHKIYLFGGYNGITVLRDLLVYEPLKDSWCSYPPMPTRRGTPIVGFFLTKGQRGIAYVTGGYDETFQPAAQGRIDAWDYNSNSWSVVNLNMPNPTYFGGGSGRSRCSMRSFGGVSRTPSLLSYPQTWLP